MKTPSEIAREISIKIWGVWNRDHEFGEISVRQREQAQHDARIYATTDLISTALQKVHDEAVEEEQLVSQILRMENKKLGGCLAEICKLLRSVNVEGRYFDQTDLEEAIRQQKRVK